MDARTILPLAALVIMLVILPSSTEGETRPGAGSKRVMRELIVDISGSGDYLNISSAIEGSTDGDTIRIRPGTYLENVVIDRPLTILGPEDNGPAKNGQTVNGPEEEGQEAIIDGMGGEYALELAADNITIRGITARNARNGILIRSGNNTVAECRCTGNLMGLSITNSSGNLIRSCNLSRNGWVGMIMGGAVRNEIRGCRCDENGGTGIHLFYSYDNVFADGTCNLNLNHGFYAYWLSNDLLLDNYTCNDNGKSGIYIFDSNSVTMRECNCSGNDMDGIYVMSTDSAVLNCTAARNGDNGLHLYHCYRSVLKNILSADNGRYGMLLKYSEENTVSECVFGGNVHGVRAASSTSGNSFHSNSFLQNAGENGQATDDGDNDWNDESGGNHWSDWTGPDDDGNGIVDSPYTMDGEGGAFDLLPMAEPPVELPPMDFTKPPLPDELADSDDDGWTNAAEKEAGSDPMNPVSTPLDLDGDGYSNKEDAYPRDPERSGEDDEETSDPTTLLPVLIGVVLLILLCVLFVIFVALTGNERKGIENYIKEHPGANVRELRKALGLKRTVTKTHLANLKMAGLISSREHRGSPRYYHHTIRYRRGEMEDKDVKSRGSKRGKKEKVLYRAPCRCGATIDIYTSRRPTTIKCRVCGARGLLRVMGNKVTRSNEPLRDAMAAMSRDSVVGDKVGEGESEDPRENKAPDLIARPPGVA